MEIILVDDGSPDSCPKICDEYAQKDNRIKVIHKENGGKHTALNTAMSIVKEELTFIVDSDDTLTPNAIEIVEKYYDQIKEKVDVVYNAIDFSVFNLDAKNYFDKSKLPAKKYIICVANYWTESKIGCFIRLQI